MSEVKSVSQVLLGYKSALEKLEAKGTEASSSDALVVLMKREAFQALLSDHSELLTGNLIAIADLDKRLKKQKNIIVKLIKLSEWRSILKPPEKHWWWFFSSKWERFDWLWNAGSILFLAVSLGLLVNTSTRLLSGGATSGNTVIVVLQSVLPLLAGGGAFTKVGKESYEKILISLQIDKQFWQEISCSLSFSVLCVLFGVNYYLPNWAIAVNRSGLEIYKNKRIESAKSDFERAIAMRPDYGEAYYNLGWLYEVLNDLDKAKTQYELAVQSDPQKFDKRVNHLKALNNLGRLYILKKEYGTAVRFLSQGILENDTNQAMALPDTTDVERVYYSLYKNLGWARLIQEHYVESEVILKSAISLDSQRSPAYCLLAQVVEAKEPDNKAISENYWQKCIAYMTPRERSQSEGDDWFGLANRRLDEIAKDKIKDKQG